VTSEIKNEKKKCKHAWLFLATVPCLNIWQVENNSAFVKQELVLCEQPIMLLVI